MSLLNALAAIPALSVFIAGYIMWRGQFAGSRKTNL